MELAVSKHEILKLFKSFLKGEISKKKLIKKLYLLEILLSDFDNGLDKGIWFRFFKYDPMATTITNLDKNIDCPRNGKYTLELLKMAIDNPIDFQVNFS